MAILMIEDEFLVAAEIRFHLERAGFQDIEHAPTETQALSVIGARMWDAAIVDANLNGCGIDSIMAELLTKRIPFVIVTGYGRVGLPRSVADARVIEKPFQPQTLINTVSQLCGQGAR